MLNYEKYKDELENIENRSLVCFIAKEKVGSQYCDLGYCSKCEKKAFKWLTSECKEPILSDEAIAYLKTIIEPVECVAIRKISDYNIGTYKLDILIKEESCITIKFKTGTKLYEYFKDMELNKTYTLKELRL